MRRSASLRRSCSPGLVPTVLAVATLMIARLGADELAHPMDGPLESAEVTTADGG